MTPQGGIHIKTVKNILSIIAAVIVVILSCFYFVGIKINYGGAVANSLSTLAFILPLIASTHLWRIQNNSNTDAKPQRRWQKILFGCILISFLVLAASLIKDSNFYSLPAILLFTLILIYGVVVFIDNRPKKTSVKNPIIAWSNTIIILYALICGVIFLYLQIVKPMTIQQATILVTQKYGEDTYDYIGRLPKNTSEDPLGVYWFKPRQDHLESDIEVSVITGHIAKRE